MPFVLLSTTLAQDTGQVCVQSFEDRDGDGLRDSDERAIAHGVSAGLQNPAGVTIASRLLEDSPFAADGLLCFDQLLAGDYQISLRSAEFTITTAAVFSASVSPGAAPALVEFGLQPLHAEEPSPGASRLKIDATLVEAVLPFLVGGAVVLAILSVIGLLTFLAVFRRRMKRAPAMPNRAPLSGDARREPVPDGGSPLFADEETDTPAAIGLTTSDKDE
ncbi:MAG: hypothetical protein OXG53_20365 [Chloroflexi bacterium]|nr:hypothetical protein [Chloroflexota bacterium]